MKIRPVILCGGAGTRLWRNTKKNQAKQFIDFGGWTLLGKTLERVKHSSFDAPIFTVETYDKEWHFWVLESQKFSDFMTDV